MTSINLLENDEKNDLVKQFSRNFAKNFNLIRLSSQNNKSDNESTKKNIRNKEKIDSTKNTDKTFFNSLFDLEYLNFSSKRNRNKFYKDMLSNKNSKYQSYQNRSPLNKYTKFRTSSTHFSYSVKQLNKKIINIASKIKNKSKNMKKSINKIKIEPIYKGSIKPKKNNERSMKNLRKKFLDKENTDILQRPKISKNSLFIIKNKYDKNALYQPYQMKEKNIEKNFSDFYTKTLKENLSCSFIEKSPNHSLEKYNEFYENKIRWKKDIEEKIKKEKIKKEQNKENIMNNYKFKPLLDKNSLNMVKEIEKDENELDEKNRRRSLDKYKAKLKNIIINIYNDKLIMNKKKNKFNRTNTNINLFSKNNSTNKINENKKTLLKKNNHNIRTKIQKKEQNKIKEEYKNKENDKTDVNKNFNKINKYTYILQKKKKFRKRNEKQKESDKYELYKINVNDGCAWMKQTLNNIPYVPKYKKLIKKTVL